MAMFPAAVVDVADEVKLVNDENDPQKDHDNFYFGQHAGNLFYCNQCEYEHICYVVFPEDQHRDDDHRGLLDEIPQTAAADHPQNKGHCWVCRHHAAWRSCWAMFCLDRNRDNRAIPQRSKRQSHPSAAHHLPRVDLLPLAVR